MTQALAAVYLPIIPDASKIAPGVKQALGHVEKDSAKSGRTLGTRLGGAMTTALKASAASAGVAVGGVLGAAMTKGMGRLVAIDTAEAKLSGLGHSAKAVTGIMDDALASVKGTAFGLGEAGTAAASAVAAGIKPGQDLQRTLKLMGDAAAIAGTDLGSMASIFNKVATSGKIQGDVLAQLGDAGIPIVQLLSEELGVAADQVYKLASDGKIGFEQFQAAMESGMGGAALALGDTFTGAVDNAGAALGRLGAVALEPFFDDMGAGVRAFTEHIDTLSGVVGPVAVALREDLGVSARDAGLWIQQTVLPAVDKLATQARSAWPTVENLGGALAGAIDPAYRIGAALTEAAASLGVSSWQLLLTALDATAAVLSGVVVPVLGTVADLAEDNTWAVTALVAAWTAFKTVPGVLDKVKTSMSGLTTASQGIADLRDYARETGSEMSRMEAAVTYAGTSSNATLAEVGRAASQAGGGLRSVGAAGIAAAKGGLATMRSSVGNLVNALGGPLVVGLGAAVALLGAEKAAAADAARGQEELAATVRDGKSAQEEFAVAVAGTTGELGDQALAAAARIAAAELGAFVTEGERAIGPTERLAMSTVDLEMHLRDLPGLYSDAGRAQLDQTAATKRLREEYDTLESAMGSLKMPMSDLNSIVAEGGEDYDRLIAHLRGMGEEGAPVAARLEAVREKLEQLEAGARALGPGFLEGEAAMAALSDAAGDATTATSDLHRAMQALGLAPKDAEQAMMDAADAVDQFAAEVESFPVDLDSGVGMDALMIGDALNHANPNARELNRVLGDMRAELYNVAINGGDTAAVFESMQPALMALAEKLGVTEDDMRSLVEAQGLIPREIDILVGADPTAAQSEIAGVITALEGIPEGETIKVDLSGDARVELEQLGWEVSEMPDGTVEVTAQTEDAREQLRAILMNQLAIDSTKAEPVVDLWAAPFDAKAGTVLGRLQGLDQAHATSTADLDTVPVETKAATAHGTLDGVAGRRPTPVSDLNNGPLDANAGTAHGTLNALDGERPEPVADLNNEPLRTGVNDARNWIQRLIDDFHGFAINLTLNAFRNVRDIFTSDGGAARGGTIGALAAGGSIRDLTGGGHLPTSGPGTHTTDGFLGVDRGGMPIVRVDAGEEVITSRQAAKHRGFLKALNAGDPRAERAAKLTGLETGGTIGSREGLERALREAWSSHNIGARYSWGGTSREAADCSGFVGRVAWSAQGVDPDRAGRMGTTHTMLQGQWPGFKRGRRGPFIVGVNSEHMAASLDGIPVESGGDVGGPSVGEGDGANDPQFTEHWYLDHAAFAPPYADKPVVRESAEVVSYGTDTGGGGTTSGGDARSVPLSPEASEAAEKASQDKDHPLFGTGADSLSELGGNLVGGAVTDHLASLLRVLSIPDSLPPLVKAGRTWYQQVEDDATEREIEENDAAVTAAAEAEEAAKEADAVDDDESDDETDDDKRKKDDEPFDRGGHARGRGYLKKDVVEPERVLSPQQTKAFDELVYGQLDQLAGLAESVVSSGVSSAVGAGAGVADTVVPGSGAMVSALGGPAGDLAGWYAGEVTGNLVQTGATFAKDITGIVGAQLNALSPVALPPVERAAPIPDYVPTSGTATRRVTAGEGGVHFHVADMHTAITKARRIAADEARGLIGV